VTLERISERDLASLVEREILRAATAGCRQIRKPAAFQAHLVDVARRAERVAVALQRKLPPEEAPDPTAAFIAGAWHDGGKIWNGDDYHEIAGAVEVLSNGSRWGLVRGSASDARAVLRRAAAAIIPHFAIYEQWQACYVPTAGVRPEATYGRLVEEIGGPADGFNVGCERGRLNFLPSTIDALVVMYSDMGPFEATDQAAHNFEGAFERRWLDLTRFTETEDPSLARILPAVRPRIHDGCALIAGFLTHGFNAEGLRRFRTRLARWPSSSAATQSGLNGPAG
jgi:hypothetical protein